MSEQQHDSDRYAPDHFAKLLAAGEFDSGPSMAGFVKPSDQSDHISFSRGQDCENWIDIPFSLIRYIRRIDERRCHDHTHPYVYLILHQDLSPEVAALTAMIAQVETTEPPLADIAAAGTCFGRHPRCPSRAPCKQLINGRYYCTTCCLTSEAGAPGEAAPYQSHEPFATFEEPIGETAACRPPLQPCGPYC